MMLSWKVGVAIALVAWIARRYWPATIAAERPLSLDPYQIAFLAGGAKRVSVTVLAQLRHTDLAIVWQRYLRVNEPIDETRVASLSEGIEVDAWCSARVGARGHEFNNGLRDSIGSLATALRAKGLRHQPRRGQWVQAVSLGPLIAWLLFVLATILDRPSSGGLSGLLALAVGTAFCLYLARLPLRTPAGWKHLRRLRKRHGRDARKHSSSESWLLAVALHGLPTTDPLNRFVNAANPIHNQKRSGLGCGGCGGCGGCE